MNRETENNLLKKIESIGFSPYEAKVFLVLYKGYKMSAAEIAKYANIPRTSVYDILTIFVKRGLCNEVDTPSKKIYEVIDYKVIEDKTKNEIVNDYHRKLGNFQSCFQELRQYYKSEQPPEFKADVELVRGFNMQREQKFMELIRSSKKIILFMNRFTAVVSDEIDKEGRKYFKRGGVFKSIYESSGNFRIKIKDKWQSATRKDLIRICEKYIKQGEQIRLLDKVPQIVAIFDEKIVYIRLHDENIPDRDSSDVIIKNKNFASFITNLFDMYWDKAGTIEAFKKHYLSKIQKIS